MAALAPSPPEGPALGDGPVERGDGATSEAPPVAKPGGWRCSGWVKVLVFVSVIIALMAASSSVLGLLSSRLVDASQWMQAHRPGSLVAYLFVMSFWILVCLPSTLIEIAGGFIFGFATAVPVLVTAKQVTRVSSP
jgi:hypothetical protein